VGEVDGAVHRQALDERRLGRSSGGDDQPVEADVPHAFGDGQHAAAGSQLAAERQLPEHREACQSFVRHLTTRGQDAAGDRQVEAGSGLAQGRRREIDGHAFGGELEAGVLDRRPYPLARLAHGAIAQADDREGRQARAEIDLDGHAARLEPVEGEGVDVGDHLADGKCDPRVGRRRTCHDIAQGAARKCEALPARKRARRHDAESTFFRARAARKRG